MSLTIIIPYIGKSYWFFKNFEMGRFLGNICTDLSNNGKNFSIINPNEDSGIDFNKRYDLLISLTRYFSNRQMLAKEWLNGANNDILKKTLAHLVVEKSFQLPVKNILYCQPTYNKNVYTYLSILKEIKRHYKNITIICYGLFFWDKAQFLLKQYGFIDYILGLHCRDQVRKIINKQKFKDITNIVNRKKIIMPKMSNDCFAMHSFPNHFLLTKKLDIAGIEFSIGCPFDCFFCDYKANSFYFKLKDLSVLTEEINFNYEHGVTNFWFHDPSINFDENRLRDFCKMVSGTLRPFRWSAPIIPFPLRKSTFLLMKRAGCIHLRFGIETVNSHALSQFNKRISLRSIRNNLEYANQAGIANSLTFMVGLPGETRKDQAQKLDFILNNKKIIQSVKIYVFEIRRGTPICKAPEKFHLKLRPDEFEERYLAYDIIGGLKWEAIQLKNHLLCEKFQTFLKKENIPSDIPEQQYYSLIQHSQKILSHDSVLKNL